MKDMSVNKYLWSSFLLAVGVGVSVGAELVSDMIEDEGTKKVFQWSVLSLENVWRLVASSKLYLLVSCIFVYF
jgi:hypothetical protein